MTDVAPNYPAAPPAAMTLQVSIIEESHWMHAEHQEISAHFYLMVMGLGCIQLGTRVEGHEEDTLLMPLVFEQSKGGVIETSNFGTIKFPEDFIRMGTL